MALVCKDVLQSKILDQLEFYFGDQNLPTDHFMQRTMRGDNGYIPIGVLLRFKMLAALTRDPDLIAATVVKYGDATILEVDKTGKKIRRKLTSPLPVSGFQLPELMDRAVFCEGFPKCATADELLQFVDTNFGNSVVIKIILQKRDVDQRFNGNVFLIFNRKEQAEDFVKRNSFKYTDGVDITIVKDRNVWEQSFREIHRRH